MGSSTNIGYGFIHNSNYDSSTIESFGIEEDDGEAIIRTKYNGLYLISDNTNDCVRFVFGNLTILDTYCYNAFEEFSGPIPDEAYLKKLRKDFELFLQNEDLPEDLADPKNWNENYYIQLND